MLFMDFMVGLATYSLLFAVTRGPAVSTMAVAFVGAWGVCRWCVKVRMGRVKARGRVRVRGAGRRLSYALWSDRS